MAYLELTREERLALEQEASGYNQLDRHIYGGYGARGIELMAKWNGTTFDEEAESVKMKKKVNKKYIDSLTDEQRKSHGGWVANASVHTAGSYIPFRLPKSKADACKFFNKRVKKNADCCNGQECNVNCPNCTYRMFNI